MKRSLLPALAVVAGLALVALLIYGVAAKEEDRTIDDALKKGQRVELKNPDRKLPLLDGSEFQLSELKGQVVVLNFWASWCEPCKHEAPALERFQKQAVKQNGTVLGISYRDTEPDAEEFIKQYDLTYPNIRDVNGDLARDFNTLALPETFVIDRQGKIAAAHRGPVDSQWLAENVDPLLAEPV